MRQYAEGFDYYPTGFTGAQIQAVLEMDAFFPFGGSLAGLLSIGTPGRFGYGHKLQWRATTPFSTPNAAAGLVRPLPAHNTAGLFIATGLHLNANVGTPPVLGLFDAVANAFQCCVSFEANGVVKAWNGAPGSGTFLGASDAGEFLIGVDFDVEVFLKPNASTGEIEVRIDTDSVLHLVNVNTIATANAYADSWIFGLWAGGNALNNTSFDQDDLRVYDTAGAHNNAFLGTCRVQTCLAAGNGSTTDFTRSNTGLANWQNIANTNIDDTLYLFDATPTDFNLSTIQPLVNTAAPVFWVELLSYLRQDDATQITAKNRLVSGATTLDGAAFLTTQTYSADRDGYETDPATGLAFLGTAVNALQVGPCYVSHA